MKRSRWYFEFQTLSDPHSRSLARGTPRMNGIGPSRRFANERVSSTSTSWRCGAAKRRTSCWRKSR